MHGMRENTSNHLKEEEKTGRRTHRCLILNGSHAGVVTDLNHHLLILFDVESSWIPNTNLVVLQLVAPTQTGVESLPGGPALRPPPVTTRQVGVQVSMSAKFLSPLGVLIARH